MNTDRRFAPPQFVVVPHQASAIETVDDMIALDSGVDGCVVHFWIDNTACTAESRQAA
ncbi:MAG: hypothetical protein JF887_02015 [Candidatus Dormibacteraeota bacterium]|uniref:Uncharacterized protein n=1 Tax=Candidatus Amunia macphersoniae TaxID=3127014 RepID=A0A934KN59_9BACT|nr:hypothetical protein [Candidatus Dormibacteraeota bacterium]